MRVFGHQRSQGLGFGVEGLGLGCLGLKLCGSGLGVGFGFWFLGLGFRVKGLGSLGFSDLNVQGSGLIEALGFVSLRGLGLRVLEH